MGIRSLLRIHTFGEISAIAEHVVKNAHNSTSKGKPRMAVKCPHCHRALDEDWLKKQGAALMGKTGGKRKARNSAQARKAANERWARLDKEII